MLNIKSISIIATLIFTVGLVGSFLTYKSLPEAEKRTETLTDTAFSEIEIDANDGEIIITSTEEEEPRIEVTGINLEKNYTSKMSDQTLFIEFQQRIKKFFNFGFNEPTKRVHLFIPEEKYEAIKVNTKNGKINTDGVDANELHLHANNGLIHIQNSEVNLLNADATNGQVSGENIVGEKVKLQSDNGRIKLQHAQVGLAEIATKNGKIDLHQMTGDVTAKANNGAIDLKNKYIDGDIDFVTDNGKILIVTEEEPNDVEINAEIDLGTVQLFGEKTSHVIYGEGKHQVNLRADNGKITVE